jgi:hypothetical protein
MEVRLQHAIQFAQNMWSKKDFVMLLDYVKITQTEDY